jgi:glucose/mannose-6-phosphate isomerase
MITHESSLKDFTDQIQFVLDNYQNHNLSVDSFDHIILCGLGGSGIASTIVHDYYYSKSPKPITCVKDYHLPAFASNKSLIILNSYSGNTEETLSLYEQANQLNCKLIVLSSGGQITDLASASSNILYTIPEGFQPRMTIGFGLSYLLLILGDLNGQSNRDELEEVISGFGENHEKQINTANNISGFFSGAQKYKFVIVCDQAMYGPAVRFSQQLNENAKLEAFVNVLPESNHNVIESYTDKLPTNFIFLHTQENDRVGARFDFLLGHLEMDNNRIVPVVIPEYTIYSIFDVIYRLDWVSVNIANELDAPLMDVPIISDLKSYLTSLEIIEVDESDEVDLE